MFSEHAVYLHRAAPAATLLPQRRPIVGIERDHDTVTLGGEHRLKHHRGRTLTQGRHHTAGVKPAGMREDPIPIDLTWLYLRNRGVPAIHHADRATAAEAAFKEIDSIARFPAD